MAVEQESQAPLDALARASRALAEGRSLGAVLDAVCEAAAAALGASVATLRVLDADGRLSARAVRADSAAIAAELEGSRVPAYGDGELDENAPLPEHLRASGAALVVPIGVAGERLGVLELARARPPFGDRERVIARMAADQAAVAILALAGVERRNGAAAAGRLLELAGEALAAGADESRTADEVARVAVDATGALGCVLWRREDGAVAPVASFGERPDAALATVARRLAEDALVGGDPVAVSRAHGTEIVTLQLGQPVLGALQLFFPRDGAPPVERLAMLGTFGVRAAHALRAGERARSLSVELERTRALLGLVARTNERLSLAHTLETAIERVSELLGTERMGVYLREGGRLTPAAGRALAGPHVPIAERLLELALGPFRGRGMVAIEDAAADPRLAGLERQLEETGIEAAVAVPLAVPDGVTGLLALYPPRGRTLEENETVLVRALAAQLAVAVENARLHERATELGAELEEVLALERQSARQVGAFYEISRSFVQSLSLEATLDAVARTVVELLDVDGAVIHMPDERGELLVPRAVHVADVRLGEALRAVLSRPVPLATSAFRGGRALRLDAETARQLSEADALLVPFLEKGSTAVILPIATPTELHGTVKMLSLDPARPITDETVEIGLSLARQAALAIDNARLYQQQKAFSDSMQRSLLPRTRPELAGLEIGDVYESSARVEVGGDVYDFMPLADGRLAVVLGDVTGHGIDAAADMAMAKFVFRSLAREHPEPGAFLAAANEVVCGEIASGKFITMLYLVADPARGELACASAGHPRPRLVLPDGTVRAVDVRGLALGIEPGQTYEEARVELPPGGSVVLYTDGVVEARRGRELYGAERLDEVLAAGRELPPEELANAALADCRAYAGAELADDCALVVIKRPAG